MYSPEEIKKAKKKVKAKKEFYQHLMVFVVVNAFLFLLNMFGGSENVWFHYPFLGWGMAIVFHYVEVFGVPGFDILNQEWEERELQNELTKNDKFQHKPRKTALPDREEEKLELKEVRKNYDESDLV